jgi:hypothetical protein
MNCEAVGMCLQAGAVLNAETSDFLVKLLLKEEVAPVRNYYVFRLLYNLIRFTTVTVLHSFTRISALIFRIRNTMHDLEVRSISVC